MTQAGTRSATPSAVPRFTRLEAVDPADVARDRGIDPMATEADVRAALAADRLSPEGFGALLSPAAEPLLEELAAAARRARRRWFGSTAYLFTPLYLANYCDNHCVYCGFNRDNAPVSTARASSPSSTPSRRRGSRRSCCSRAKTARAPTPPTSARRASWPPSASAWWAWKCTP